MVMPISKRFTPSGILKVVSGTSCVRTLVSMAGDCGHPRPSSLCPAAVGHMLSSVGFGSSPGGGKIWAQYAQVLLSSNDFIFVE